MASDVHQLARYVSAFRKARVLCVGDIMLDRYVYGEVGRVSAEAPIPVMSHKGEQVMLGATGNVARNVVALGGRASVIAIVGADEAGREIARLCSQEERLEAHLVPVRGRRTTLKTRFVARGQQLLRADQEDVAPPDESVQEQLLELYESMLPEIDAVLLSDYAKGCLSERVLSETIRMAREADKPVVVDPKSQDFSRYDGASLIKPNAKELAQATGAGCTDDESTAASARIAMEQADIDAVLVTRSEQGMTLVRRGQRARHFRERSSEVFDVSGAGDTALAAMGLALGVGATLPKAVILANKACCIVVSKVGTAAVYSAELMQALRSEEFETAGAKVTHLQALMDRVTRWRAQGLRVGLTNGCFDLIHAGHVSLLAQSKKACDRLIVALNSDESVQRLKGEGRPINNGTARAMVLASFGDVDAVIQFEEDTPMRLIEAIRPDVLVKGADYTEREVVGAEFVRSYGGTIHLAELSPELSTTRTIDKIKG